MIEKRLERVATEKKGGKIEADLDGRHVTRKTIFVDAIQTDDGISKSEEDEYIFYHGRHSINAELKQVKNKKTLVLTSNDDMPNDEG